MMILREAFISFTRDRACALKKLLKSIKIILYAWRCLRSESRPRDDLPYPMMIIHDDYAKDNIFIWYLRGQQVVYPWEEECACPSFHTQMACPISWRETVRTHYVELVMIENPSLLVSLFTSSIALK